MGQNSIRFWARPGHFLKCSILMVPRFGHPKYYWTITKIFWQKLFIGSHRQYKRDCKSKRGQFWAIVSCGHSFFWASVSSFRSCCGLCICKIRSNKRHCCHAKYHNRFIWLHIKFKIECSECRFIYGFWFFATVQKPVLLDSSVVQAVPDDSRLRIPSPGLCVGGGGACFDAVLLLFPILGKTIFLNWRA